MQYKPHHLQYSVVLDGVRAEAGNALVVVLLFSQVTLTRQVISMSKAGVMSRFIGYLTYCYYYPHWGPHLSRCFSERKNRQIASTRGVEDRA